METPPSFAPLAARLAIQVAKIRPLDGARNDWDKVGALLVCLVLEFLIALCHALDARATTLAARAAAAMLRGDVEPSAVVAPRAQRQAPSSERRVPRLALASEAQAAIPESDDVPRRTTERPVPAAPRLVWSHDPGPIRAVLALPWRPRRETRAFAPALKHAYFITI